MKKLTSKEIKQMWLDFFKKNQHKIIPSKSLVPVDDPSLLWINSGVATIKPYFSGIKKPPSLRLVNFQRAIRTNDIENVGLTTRHHTLFEMLGSFSIGDYFKHEALKMAYELLFDIFKFSKKNIYITYFEDDIETYKQWLKLGIDDTHLIKGNKETNFWDMGLGPSGPDTEIFYDRGKMFDPKNVGINLLKNDLENDRYVEIWNIVFSEFNNDGKGNYVELVQKNIDTGAGFERIVSIIQKTPTNFETDLFWPIIKKIEIIINQKYDTDNYFKTLDGVPNFSEKNQNVVNQAMKIIADHMRAVTIAIHDGVYPSNTQRGYIIRRLIRRAFRQGILVARRNFDELKKGYLYELVPTIANLFDSLNINVEEIQKVIRVEEKTFARTLGSGEKELSKLMGDNNINAQSIFKLFETYGFPFEMSLSILKSAKFDVPTIKEIQVFIRKHALKSKPKITHKAMATQLKIIQNITSKQSSFTGYESLAEFSKVIFQGEENNLNYVLLNKTPFYATSGGQEKDEGIIDGQKVLDIFKDKQQNIWHVIKQNLSKNYVSVAVDHKIRYRQERNHSATHLLGFALRQIFGNGVIQLGSNNNENKLRFDFSLEQRPTKNEINKIEVLVNQLINQKKDRVYLKTSLENARKLGAIALKNENYGKNVRIVKIGKSIELCGGTHVKNSKDIEKFKIIKFESKGSRIFRIEAITSLENVQKFVDKQIIKKKYELEQIIQKNLVLNKSYSLEFKKSLPAFEQAIIQAKLDNKKLNKALKNLKINFNNFLPHKINGVEMIKKEVPTREMKQLAIKLREAFPMTLIVLTATSKNLVVIASNKYDSFSKIKEMFPNFKGGGNKKFAMGKIN